MDDDDSEREVFLNANVEPCTAEALEFTADLARDIWAEGRTGTVIYQPFRNAVGSIVGALLRSAFMDPKAWVYRPMGKDSFKGERIGRHQFKGVTDGMQSLGLLAVELGYRGGRYKGRATRFRPKAKLIKLAERYGVPLTDWVKHYRWLPRPTAVAEPLVLKTASTMTKGRRQKGVRIPVDLSRPLAAKLGKQVNELNAYLAPMMIEPEGIHWAFQRMFAQADLPGVDMNKGGRLYSVGYSYQQMSNRPEKAKASPWGIRRVDMTINGEPVVEIDITASHLTILHSLLGFPFDPHGPDPYDHPSIPREVVKGWVTMTLGHDRFQRGWSEQNKERYRESKVGSGDLQKDYPIAVIREEIPKLLPVLQGWEKCPVRWGDLQYLESCAVVDAVHTLAIKHDIPALPVHDSIIVPVSGESIARKVLEDCFEHHIGVKPALKATFGK